MLTRIKTETLWLAGLLVVSLVAPSTVDASPPAALAEAKPQAKPGPEPEPKPERKKAVERIGEQAARGLVQEGLETLDQDANRARLGRVLNSTQTRNAVHDLTESFVIGLIDGFVAGGSDNIDLEVGKSMRQGIDRHLTPAMERMVGRVVDSALEKALAEQHISQLEALSERATYAAIRGLARGLEEELGPALAATIRKDLGPALALVVERDMLPALGRGLDTPAMQLVVANLTRSVATEFVVGFGEAMQIQAAANEAQGKTSGLQLFGDKVAQGYMIALFVAFALATVLIGLTVVMFRNSRRLRKQSEVASQREAALLNLIDSLESDHPELKANVRQLLEDQLEARA